MSRDRECDLCGAGLDGDTARASRGTIVGLVCKACTGHFQTTSAAGELKDILDAIDEPVLLMQADPRQVFTANKQALELFNKGLVRIEKHRGGQVFDCIHAFSAAGCGRDENCLPCKIKNAIVETLTTGRPCTGISAVLDIKASVGTQAHALQISTERIGEMVLVRIDRFEQVG